MPGFKIHERLLADAHLLGRIDAGHLLLHRDAGLPWFIVVPETGAVDLLDLETEQRIRVMDACAALTRYIKEELGFPKVNLGAIGNIVPQLHVHVVGRAPGDPCWPHPVWGKLATDLRYDEDRVAALAAAVLPRLA